MTESPPARARKPAIALLATVLALALSACGSILQAPDIDEKVRRAEAAAQRAIAAQHAAEAAAARIRRHESVDRRGDGEDEEANYQDTGPPPLAGNAKAAGFLQNRRYSSKQVSSAFMPASMIW